MKVLTQLNPRDRRALVLGGAVLAGALVFRLGVKPYIHARAALAERVREQEGLLMRELALVQGAPDVSVDLTALARGLKAEQPRLLDARDPMSATAALVGAVGDDAHRHGVLIEAIESRPATPLGDGLTAVQVDVRGRGDLEGVLRWLYAMETAGRLWRVEQLSLVRLDGAAPADSADSETLTFAMSIRAFTMGSGASHPHIAHASLGVAP